MTVDECTNKMLVVPFNKDYKLEKEIEEIFTEDEFFEECFLKPFEDDEIKEALKEISEEVKDFEIDFEKSEMLEKLDKQKEEYSALETWIKSRQPDLYCVKGDAGTGKTTFLHYLKYKYKNADIIWHIIDIQKAVEKFYILGKVVLLPDFTTSIYSKTISVLLLSFKELLFVCNDGGAVNCEASANNIQSICEKFRSEFLQYFPRSEVCDFFNSLEINNSKDYNATCSEISEKFQTWCNDILNNSCDLSQCFSVILETYLYCILCQNTTVHHIIAFDNFERFIGTDEIYNEQLTEFVANLRSIQNDLTTNNICLNNTYQLIVFMRNTSVRMFTSQQVTEFFPHTVDLSDWFDASSILKKKLQWYENHNIDIEAATLLLSILNDMGATNSSLQGLHLKISMLFNYNKRLVIRFLSRILIEDVNKPFIETYISLLNNTTLTPDLQKFATRNIIFRLILNALKNDGFFANIIEEELNGSNDSYKNSNDEPCEHISYLGYARKILSILHEYHIKKEADDIEIYMPFDKMISEMYPNNSNEKRLFNSCNEKTLDTIAQVLYYMNYYDGRKQNWLQLIDIQYNMQNINRVTIDSYQTLKEYILNNSKNINIRITNAGCAYLYFVVYYFEFFSCKTSYSKTKIDLYPLLCTIPSVEEIVSQDIENLHCIKILRRVLADSKECISILNADENPILFRPNIHSKFITHQERIINSHHGFINNFKDCLNRIYFDECENNEKFKLRFDSLVSIINNIKTEYTSINKKNEEE